MSKNARVFVGIAWLFLGVFVSLKGENFLLRHQWYSVGLGAAWTLAYLAISGGKTADSELRSKRFHMLWFLGSAAIGTLFLAFSFITDFWSAVSGFVIVIAVVTSVKQASLYRQASHSGIPKLDADGPHPTPNHG